MMEQAGSGGPVRLKSESRYYVYILRLSDSRHYVGYTRDLNKRMDRHANGYVPFTKPLRPLKLETYISFSDKYQALAFEKYLKSGSGRAFMNKRLIIKQGID